MPSISDRYCFLVPPDKEGMSALSFKNERASLLQINDLEKEGAFSSLGPCVASLLILWCLTHFLSSQEAQMKSKRVAAGDSSRGLEVGWSSLEMSLPTS